MVSRKGYVRIIESLIAILLIIATLLVLLGGPENNSGNDGIEERTLALLEEIAKNDTSRERIISANNGIEADVQSWISEGLKNPTLIVNAKICPLWDACDLVVDENDLFVFERIVSTGFSEFSPKRIRVFIWKG